MTLIWLGLIIVLTLLEFTAKKLVTFWFVTSAFVSLILSFFIDSFFIQFLVFIILGFVLLITTRDYLLKLINDKKQIKRGKNEK